MIVVCDGIDVIPLELSLNHSSSGSPRSPSIIPLLLDAVLFTATL